MFIFECYGDHRDLHVLTHSFPTRRSSELRQLVTTTVELKKENEELTAFRFRLDNDGNLVRGSVHSLQKPLRAAGAGRSEEHVELQSLMRISYAVFCLKKNNHQK